MPCLLTELLTHVKLRILRDLKLIFSTYVNKQVYYSFQCFTIKFINKFLYNTELNDLRKIICLRKSEVSVDRISVCYIKNLAEHCLPCSCTNDDINMLP